MGIKYLNPTEACKYLGISRHYLYKLVQQKRISFFRAGGKRTGRLSFLLKDLDEYRIRVEKIS